MGPFQTKASEILIKIQKCFANKLHLKVSSEKYWHFLRASICFAVRWQGSGNTDVACHLLITYHSSESGLTCPFTWFFPRKYWLPNRLQDNVHFQTAMVIFMENGKTNHLSILKTVWETKIALKWWGDYIIPHNVEQRTQHPWINSEDLVFKAPSLWTPTQQHECSFHGTYFAVFHNIQVMNKD